MVQTNRIKALRIERRLTQSQLAQKVGTSTRAIQRLENSERSLDATLFGTVLNIAKALDVTVYDLITNPTDEQTRG